jgi:O-antigen ligase
MYVEIFSLMDPNDFSGSLAIAFALCLTVLLKKKKIILNIVCLLIVLGIVYLSGSRGGLLTMMCIVLIWILSMKGRTKYIVLITMAVLAAGFLLCAEFGIGPSQISRFSVSALISGGGTGRSEIWKAAIDYFIKQNPVRMLIGNGLGSFADTVHYIAPGFDFTYESHNMYINTLIEGGIIGFGLITACFTSLYIHAFRKKNIFGIMAVTGFLVTGISLDVQVYRTFAIAAAVAVLWHEMVIGQVNRKDVRNTLTGEK